MSIRTHLSLPLHAHSIRLMKVMARLVHAPFTFSSSPAKAGESLDCLAPASRENPWNLKFERGAYACESREDTVENATLLVTRPDGEDMSWHLISEYGEDDTTKHLDADVCPLNAAVAEGVVRFFGGKLTVIDTTERIDMEVSPKKALFPPTQKGQDGDARWYQFENALLALAPLTAEQVLRHCSATQVSVETAEIMHAPFLKFVRAKELQQRLDQAFIEPQKRTSRPRM